MFELSAAPRSLAVLGGGPVGCELAQAFARFGVAVTVIEARNRLLPVADPQAGDVLLGVFGRAGIDVRLATTLTEVVDGQAGGPVRLALSDGAALEADRLLVAAGRRPVTDGLDVEAGGVGLDERGFIRTDARLATTAAGVYATGDVTGRLAFTHAAAEMGRLAAANAFRRLGKGSFHAGRTPWVTFTDPEVAHVGMTEAAAAAHGGRVAYLPMTEVDRAVTAGATDGFVKLIAGPRPVLREAGGGRLLGATIVAERAGEMIAEVALGMRTGMFTGRLAQTTHAYPSWSVGVQQAAAQFFFEIENRRARPAAAPAASGDPHRSRPWQSLLHGRQATR